ncbi:LacI family DNA-binding transcriptional regulator [Paenarthrobacter sp. Z7-10]|uniref:LacI family DNA-binding transcriptional regulator n=1 Tax=Paenarthrobacter sp. Z7-10 TaxID=2787635 RepID=UPI0022A97FA0|nr:LacI family DNA-binding transcriptional regulator [Paenarthrobacter sp. Z7-10]MCZ2402451.1 LacI family DNA-binding transcriptional regulator [Paenarthrobacter sp. Z7-10]
MSERQSGARATIHDVAARAGVATSTVSRALSDPGRISARTRNLVLQAAEALDYVPNSGRRPGVAARTRAVALLVPDITNPFYFDIIHGAQEQLKAAGYTQLLVDTEESADVEMVALERAMTTADGVILAASRLPETVLAGAVHRIPLVTINRNDSVVPTVLIDTTMGVQQAVEHLVSLGHRRIAFVSGPAKSWTNQWRWQAFEAAASRHGVEALRIGPYAPKPTSGAAAADAVLISAATACIAFNDLLAIGMLQRFNARGVRVPGDFSIVGCDDIFGADFCNPPLTTITAPIEQAGRVATSMLLAALRTGQPAMHQPGGKHPGVHQVTRLPTHLTIRDSTGPAPSE